VTAKSQKRERRDPNRETSNFAAMRVAATLGTAAAAGLTKGTKGKPISGRTHAQLMDAAAKQSGLSGTKLIEYALAKVALEDDFADRLIALKNSVGRDIDLES
jgi:hypothetical protein